MRIGIDATCWQNTRGYGRVVRGLLSALVRLDVENRYAFFMDSAENSETLPPEVEVRMVANSVPTAIAASSNGHRSVRDMWRMSRAMSSRGFDLQLPQHAPGLERETKVLPFEKPRRAFVIFDGLR